MLRTKAAAPRMWRRVRCDSLPARLYTRWLAQPSPHGLFEGEVLVFLLFKAKLMKHANHRTRLGAVHATCAKISGMVAF